MYATSSVRRIFLFVHKITSIYDGVELRVSILIGIYVCTRLWYGLLVARSAGSSTHAGEMTEGSNANAPMQLGRFESLITKKQLTQVWRNSPFVVALAFPSDSVGRGLNNREIILRDRVGCKGNAKDVDGDRMVQRVT